MSVIKDLSAQLTNFVDVKKEMLMEQMMQKSVTESEMRTVMSEAQAGNDVVIPTTHLSEVIQGFQKGFTEKGDLTIGGNKVTQRRLKIDILIDPDDVVGEWEGFLYDEKKSRKDQPIVAYILNKLMGKVDEDKEEKCVVKGVFAAPTPGIPTSATAAVDGLIKVMDDAATAGKYSKFILGSLDESNAFDYVEDFFTHIPQKDRYKKLKLYMSPDNLLYYKRDKRATFQYWLNMSELERIDFSMTDLVALPSLAGSNRMFATVQGNLARIIHKNTSADNIEVESFERSIKIMGDFHTCYGIGDYRYFWSNDLNTIVP